MARIDRLTLSNFRNYRGATVEAGDARTIVLTGPNGAGKTNLIEAVSFLSPGRGLRRATLEEVAFQEGDGSWAAAAEGAGARRRCDGATQMPDRSRAGRLGCCVHRSLARGLAGAGDGYVVCRRPVGT